MLDLVVLKVLIKLNKDRWAIINFYVRKRDNHHYQNKHLIWIFEGFQNDLIYTSFLDLCKNDLKYSKFYI